MPPRRIVLLTYRGAQSIDLTGPHSVFSFANRLAGKPLYELVVASSEAPSVMHAGGLAIAAAPIDAIVAEPRDTVLVAGGEARAVLRARSTAQLTDFMASAAAVAERYGSICSGAFVLAAAGLLAGKRCATHWDAIEQLQQFVPDATVDGDALYVTDGNLWTSAGVTTGIDMALAMLALDHGLALKTAVARRLVVYAHRPGHQSQFSDLLDIQARAGKRFGPLMDWLIERLDKPIGVEAMAAQVAMSPRSFHRHFTAAMGDTPARVLDRLRLDRARAVIESGAPVGHAVAASGFRSEAAFRLAFRQRFGVTPGLYREMYI